MKSKIVRLSRVFSVLLEPSDIKRARLVLFLQIALAVFDVLGVFLFALVGSLIISPESGTDPSSRIYRFLELAKINELQRSIQISVVGSIAVMILVSKTLISFYFQNRITTFYAFRGALASAKLIKRFFEQDLVLISKYPLHRSIYALTNGVQNLVVKVFAGIILLFADSSLLIIFSVSLFITDWRMSLITFIYFGLVALILGLVTHRRARQLSALGSEVTIETSQRISELTGLYRDLFVKDRISFYVDRISILRTKNAKITAGNALIGFASKYVFELSTVLALFVFGAYQLSTQPLSRALTLLSLFLLATARIVPAIMRTQQNYLNIRTTIAGAIPTIELVEALTDTFVPQEIDYVGASKDDEILFDNRAKVSSELVVQSTSSLIRIEDLSFQYPTRENYTLRRINLEIKTHEFVAIVGPTGAGKSTLIDCILGVIKPQKGVITIDTLPPDLFVKLNPGKIGYVPQRIELIAGSLRDNVTVGFPTDYFSDEEILEAIEIAHLQDLLVQVGTLDAALGDGIIDLSGGQRQRIGIARAVLSKPKLLILDEATSSLDSVTEKQISNSLIRLREFTTLLLIAHRLSTVRSADQVIYLDSGVVVAKGTFAEVRAAVSDFDDQATLLGL